MAHVYHTLPRNNSMHYYSTNTVTHYTIRLENGIALFGDWEVGLVEIQNQNMWFNLEKGEGRVTYSQHFEVQDKPTQLQNILRLTAGYYNSVPDLVSTANKRTYQNLN